MRVQIIGIHLLLGLERLHKERGAATSGQIILWATLLMRRKDECFFVVLRRLVRVYRAHRGHESKLIHIADPYVHA